MTTAPSNKPGIHVQWKQVTYRSVLLAIMAILLLFVLGLRMAFPQFTDSTFKKADNFATDLLEKVAGATGRPDASTGMNSQQAHFTALDGTVRVKKANGNHWMNADYNVPLEKGDVIQTGAEGMAKIVFNDGTNYTVKQDSLIVVEENSTNDQQQTSVAVAVSTGTVDLSTSVLGQGSKSQVTVAGATASLAAESAATVRNDPKETPEILIRKGSGEVTKNGESVKLSPWEMVSLPKDGTKMVKQKEIGPPTPISPANMMLVFATGSEKQMDFSWTPMTNAVSYHLQISRNPYFTSSMVVDQKVSAADVVVSGLGLGAYYWMVQAQDASGKLSTYSEKNRFTIIKKGEDTAAIYLQLEPFIQHGHVIELMGKTEIGARVMVNGHEAPVVGTDGSFHYFTPPLPAGESMISITAQNAKGGVNTLQQKVLIQ